MLKDAISRCLAEALEGAVSAGKLPPDARAIPAVERTRNPAHGDYATNVAMTLAKPVRRAPAQIANEIVGFLQTGDFVARVEVAQPGFINLTLSQSALQAAVREILERQDEFGRVQLGAGERILIEYVSANPTGPLHVGHGRWAVLGSALASLLNWAGYRVHQEFYINDFGNQLQSLGKSLYLKKQGLPFPTDEKDLYGGAYVDEAVEAATAIRPELEGLDECAQIARLAEFGRDFFLAQQKAVLERLGVRFDRWTSERELHRSGAVAMGLEHLRSLGVAYEKDGALWLRSTLYGDTEDRVLVRADGRPTYIAADVAYHWDKFKRHHDRLIDLLGADHHGYIPRLKAVVACLGYDPERLEILIGQLVKLLRNGQEVRMSKRTGELVTIAEVMDEVGVAATRYFLVSRGADSPIEFDLDLARQESAENPVFYVQYAHARICSIWRMAEETRQVPQDLAKVSLESLDHPDERRLLLSLAHFPDEVASAAAAREPHRIARYCQDLATDFHQFYTNCRVLNVADTERTAARLVLVAATRIVLRNALSGILGISAPERM
ncbi:MAG: arginine--tRNA ligase [Cyanobacteria bacterium REEB65]|nr:arginine--tRNA ligase [Cyanobacteria bacterium REEB65]